MSITNSSGYCVCSVNTTPMESSSWTELMDEGIFPGIGWLLKYKELILLLSGCSSHQNLLLLLLLLDPRCLPTFAKCSHQLHQYFSLTGSWEEKKFSYPPDLQLWAGELLFFSRETFKASPRLIKVRILEMKEFLPGI